MFFLLGTLNVTSNVKRFKAESKNMVLFLARPSLRDDCLSSDDQSLISAPGFNYFLFRNANKVNFASSQHFYSSLVFLSGFPFAPSAAVNTPPRPASHLTSRIFIIFIKFCIAADLATLL